MREKARRLIRALCNIDEVYYLNEAKKKVSDAELCVMYALDDGKPHSQREISREWLVAKTSVNTIVKRWEKEGLVTMVPIPGRRREMHICLTDAGRSYARQFLGFLYRAEDRALEKTLEQYSDSFIEVIEFFGASLKEAFDEEGECGENGSGSD
ncbi:MAG: MarR family transcriptional regulator [Oscillospiraceae bacterium]|nr:MarR family transcriptional regulator [Oscillospiraceae bacterium]